METKTTQYNRADFEQQMGDTPIAGNWDRLSDLKKCKFEEVTREKLQVSEFRSLVKKDKELIEKLKNETKEKRNSYEFTEKMHKLGIMKIKQKHELKPNQ